MKFKNKNETFKQYLDRFNIFVVFLNLNDFLKINQLYRIISKRLNHNIDYLSKIKNFFRFVRKMKTIVYKKNSKRYRTFAKIEIHKNYQIQNYCIIFSNNQKQNRRHFVHNTNNKKQKHEIQFIAIVFSYCRQIQIRKTMLQMFQIRTSR